MRSPCIRPVGGVALVASGVLVGLLGLLAARAPVAEAAAQWRDLNGRVAPDLVFNDTALGLAAGTSLSSLRNRQVVLLAFWLRDCPHCKREMPQIQELYDEYGRSGLQVISVVHGFSTAEVTPAMRERGWDFPVASDPDGQMAAAYGGGRRPGFYLIGLDGRVKSSSSISTEALGEEMARFRLAELGAFPAALDAVRQQVLRGDYGGALRLGEAAAAATDAAADVQALVARLKVVAAQKIDNRRWRAERAQARGQSQAAINEVAGLPEAFQGTSLEEHARSAVAAIRALIGR